MGKTTTIGLMISHGLVTLSNILGLYAADIENKGLKIALHTGENLTKFLAFSDCGHGNSNIGILGAIGLTAMTTIDDVAINYGLYENHHLAKVGSAIYAGMQCSGGAILSGGLLLGSYLLGSGDLINTMRSNTNDSIEFTHEVYKISNGKVNVYNDILYGSLVGGTLSIGRQLIQALNLDIGGPLSGVISTTTNTVVNIISSSSSEEKLKQILVDKFQYKLRYISQEQIDKLDNRAQKILEKLPEYIEKASTSITKNATNSTVKTAYQNILAGATYGEDKTMGLSVFVSANLFNWSSADNIQETVKKNIKSMEADYEFSKLSQDDQIYTIGKKLGILQDKKSDSLTTKLWNYGKTVVKVLAPIFAGSILVTCIHSKELFNDPKAWKNAYMPIGSIVAIGETFIDVDSFTAMKQLQYLENALNNSDYKYDSLNEYSQTIYDTDIADSIYCQNPKTIHGYD